MATSTQNINIVISATGGVTVVRSLQSIATAANQAVSPLRTLQSSLRGVMTALAIVKIADWADGWTEASNKVAVFAKTQNEANIILNKLYQVSQTVRQPLNEIVALYHKLSIQSKELGVSTEQNIRFTEGIGKALTIQGTKSQEAKGALLQLSQAMGTGRIKAQEYNSLLTGLPLVLLTVAKNLDAAGGSVAKLTMMQRSGQLTSQMFYDAFMKGQPELDAMFEKTSKTFAQGFTVFNNGMTKYVGQLNDSLGISNKFYVIVKFIVDNIDTMGKLLVVIGAGVVTAFAPALITMFAGALWSAAGALGRISLLLLANPFVLIASAVAAVIAFGDSWDAAIDNVTTVKDVLRVFYEFAVAAFQDLGALIQQIWGGISSFVTSVLSDLTAETTSATGSWTNDFTDFFADTGNGFAGMVRAIAKTLDAIGGLITGLIIGIGRLFGGLPEVISAAFGMVYNAIAGWMEKAINVVITGLNRIRSAVGQDLIETVKLDKMNVNAGAFKKYGETIAASIDDGFAAQGGAMLKSVDNIFGKAAAIAKARAGQAKSAVNSLEDDSGVPGSGLAKKGKKAGAAKNDGMEKLESSLRSLLDKIDPASGALLQMEKAQSTLNAAVEKGLISEPQRQGYLVLLKNHYRDIIDPLGKINREMDEHIELLGMDVRARERQTDLARIQQEMFQKGQPLNDAEITALKARLLLTQQMNEAQKIQDALLADSVEKRRTFTKTLEEMNKLLADPASGFTKADATSKLQSELPDLFAGTQEAIDMRLEQFRGMYMQIEQMRQAEVISEQTASQMKLRVSAMESEQRLTQYSQLFGGIASLSTSSNRKIAAIGKAAAMTQATIDGVMAVQKALGSAPYPINIAMAAVVGVQAAANVAKIASTNTAFATGGDFTVGGAGGVDSQMVAFRASPGEKVSISTPQQVRHGTATKEGGGGGEAPVIRPNIVNFLDKSLLQSYLATSEGENAILNVMQNNPAAMRSAMGGR